MQQLKGYEIKGKENWVLNSKTQKLKKTIYGLKESIYVWNQCIKKRLTKLKYEQKKNRSMLIRETQFKGKKLPNSTCR